MNQFQNLSVKFRLFSLIGFMILMMTIIGLIGLRGMYDSNAGLRTVYLDRAIPLDQLAEITDLNADSILHLYQAVFYDPRLEESRQNQTTFADHLAQITANDQQATKIWKAYTETYLTPEEKVLAEEYVKLRDEFIKEKQAAFELYQQKRFSEANIFMMKTLADKFDGLNDKVDQLKTLQVNVAKEEFDKASGNYDLAFKLALFAVVFAVSIGSIIGYLIVRNLVKSLGAEPNTVADLAAKIAGGKLDNAMEVKPGDEHSVLANMHFMQAQLLERITREMEEKAKALRIQNALDNASCNVMLADQDYNIIYVNKSLLAMFKAIQDDIRQEIPGFDANQLVGGNIDRFHKNPQYQRAALSKLTTSLNSNFVLGGRHLDFIAVPVMDESGERIGIVVEWRDRTNEIKIENEIKGIVEAIKMGELSERLRTDDKSGFYQTISVEINQLTETVDSVFVDIAGVMQKMSAGDLSQKITHSYAGIYDSCKNDINLTLEKLREVFTQIQDSASFISQSSNEISSGNNNLSQRAEQQAANLQETASSMEELTSTVKHNADNALQANQITQQARSLAEQGGDVVNSAILAMQEINDSSNKIAAIIGVIDEIAFQTNLLALNASVEAARAGENGRGFSVVATEVRNLAQRSANAARESKSLIQNSIQKVRNGSDFVNQTGKSLNDIVSAVQQVSGIVAEIASASGEQSAGIEQVNQAVAQMDEITQQNAALAEQAAAASISMNEQTTHMGNLLAFFHLGQQNQRPANIMPSPAIKSAPQPKVKVPAKPTAISAHADVDSEWDEF